MQKVNELFMNQEMKVVKSRRKTLSIVVRGGEVTVRAPFGISDERIQSFVARNRDWIQKQLAKTISVPKLVLEDGAYLTLFGERYRIQSGRTRLKSGELYLPLENRQEALKRLLKKHSFAYMSALTERIAKVRGFKYLQVKISSARTRWGSCSRKGNISYTFRIAFLPPELAEYIAVHELCHTVWFNHGKEFWKLVEQVLPNWRNLRKQLKSRPEMAFL